MHEDYFSLGPRVTQTCWSKCLDNVHPCCWSPSKQRFHVFFSHINAQNTSSRYQWLYCTLLCWVSANMVSSMTLVHYVYPLFSPFIVRDMRNRRWRICSWRVFTCEDHVCVLSITVKWICTVFQRFRRVCGPYLDSWGLHVQAKLSYNFPVMTRLPFVYLFGNGPDWIVVSEHSSSFTAIHTSSDSESLTIALLSRNWEFLLTDAVNWAPWG